MAQANTRAALLKIMCIKNDTTDLRTILQPYISQISSLNITLDEAVAPEILLNDLPAFQELRVHIFHNIIVKKRDILSRILPPISRLFTLHSLELELMTCHDIKCLSGLDIAWPLTNVNIGLCHPSTIIGLLQLFPNLSSLETYILSGDGLSFEPFTHSIIQKISIETVFTTPTDSERDSVVHLLMHSRSPICACFMLMVDRGLVLKI
ncbi:hypothetical protein DFJ58DRAFT_733373 [Suillus subalutaceus]|uniref:uncharacterized protein n=1 Tax=Suillus subalutaceus TaxID=48586 RepID=UPI001B879084|nr:uncharacterized protein DFJ58DRAFT_733373 [Suillus subalutaceus]KAG1839419.1 hypothetical protein DFJ58DRAFT_733373 [Suillus subalutaceus]